MATTITPKKKKTPNKTLLQDQTHFEELGYELSSVATNGRNMITSYIGMYKEKRVYGYYDHKKKEYVEELIC